MLHNKAEFNKTVNIYYEFPWMIELLLVVLNTVFNCVSLFFNVSIILFINLYFENFT
jgi:hypothetical protein